MSNPFSISKPFLILIIISGIVLLVIISQAICFGFIVLIMYSLSLLFEPYTPQQQLNGFEYELFYPYHIGEDYEVIESESRNGHPDRPQKLTIKLSDVEFDKLRNHIDIMQEGADTTETNEHFKIKTIAKKADGCTIVLDEREDVEGRFIYSSRAQVDYQEKTIKFHGSYY